MNCKNSFFHPRLISASIILFLSVVTLTSCQPKPTTVDLATIKNAADSHTTEMAQFLSELITYKSIEKEGEDLLPVTVELMDKILARGKSFGFSARKAADGMVGILEYGEGEEIVGVIAHIDVVSAGDLSQWTHPPFEGKIVDGVIWGRGAQDDKAGAIGTIWGAKILIDNQATFNRKLRILLVTKEETGFGAINKYLQEEAPPTFGIVPDGLFIIRAENGYLDAKYIFTPSTEADAPPKALPHFVHWQGGSAVNAIPDTSIAVLKTANTQESLKQIQQSIQNVAKLFPASEHDGCKSGNSPCSAQVNAFSYSDYISSHPGTLDDGHSQGDIVITATGITGHSSTPQKGRNAIVDLAQVTSRLDTTENAIKNAMNFAAREVSYTTDGSNFSLNTEKPIKEAADTTACLSLISQLSSEAGGGIELNINYRAGVANTNNEILEKSGAIVARYNGSVTAHAPMFDAYYYKDDDPLLNAAKTSYETVTGNDAPLIPIAATTQVKAVPNFVAFGPVDAQTDGVHFHATNERMPVSSLTRNAALYAHMLQQLIQSPTTLTRE